MVDDQLRAELAQPLRQLIAAVEIHPLADGRTGIVVRGILSALLGTESDHDRTETAKIMAEGMGHSVRQSLSA